MSRRPLLAIAVVLASVISPIARGASADSTSDQQKLDKIAAQLAQMGNQASILDEQLLEAQADAQQAQADVAATQLKIVDLQQQLGVVQSQVSQLALNAFATGDSNGGLGALLGDPTKLTTSVERDQATKVVFADGQDSVDKLGAGVVELNKQQALLAKQQQIAQQKATVVASKQTELQKGTDALVQLQAATEAQFGKDKVAEAEAAQQKALEVQQAAQVKAAAAAAAVQAAKDKASADQAAKDRAAVDQAAADANRAAAQAAKNRGAASTGGTATASGSGNLGSTGSTTTAASGSSGGNGSSGTTDSGGGATATAPPAPPPPARSSADLAVRAAMSQVGVPYIWATASPGQGFDCSGLTMWAWSQAGVNLPHQSRAQFSTLPRVSQADVQPGDLLFFGSPIHHVSMYIGNDMMVEAPAPGKSVWTRAVNWGTVVGIGRP